MLSVCFINFRFNIIFPNNFNFRNGPKEQSNGDAQEGSINVKFFNKQKFLYNFYKLFKVFVTGIEQSVRHLIHTAISSFVCLKKLARVIFFYFKFLID